MFQALLRAGVPNDNIHSIVTRDLWKMYKEKMKSACKTDVKLEQETTLIESLIPSAPSVPPVAPIYPPLDPFVGPLESC